MSGSMNRRRTPQTCLVLPASSVIFNQLKSVLFECFEKALRKGVGIFGLANDTELAMPGAGPTIKNVLAAIPPTENRETWVEWADGGLNVTPVGVTVPDLDPNTGIGKTLSEVVNILC